MTIRFLGVIIAGLTLSACAGADYPGFVDAAVEVTTGVDLQDGLEGYLEQENGENQATARSTAAPQAVVRTPTPSAPSSRIRASAGGGTSQFRNWSALVIAGDYHATTGADTEAFDNARRDIATQLRRIGFEPQNITQFSIRPERYREVGLLATSFDAMDTSLRRSRRRGDDGCLVYMTSHGYPTAFAVGASEVITPVQINQMLDDQCGDDPTILVVSACYSGIFAQGDMLKPNRFIMTAARSDRTSFGCGEGTRYPNFDACVLESFATAGNWVDIARNTRSCVEAREQTANLTPPSSPQIYMGPEAREIMLSPFVIAQSDDYGPQLPGY